MAPKLMMALALALALGLMAPRTALGHGGSLHQWDFSTPGYNYTRYQLATCSSFNVYNPGTNTTLLPGPLPYWPVTNVSNPLNVTGFVELWLYLDATCRVTESLLPYLIVSTPNGQPYANNRVYAFGFTGSCSNGVTNIYRNNATLEDNRMNMVWWRDALTTADGIIWGSAPNTFNPRRPNMTDPLSSLLLVPPATDGPMMCCDFQWGAPADDWVATAVPACLNATTNSNLAKGRRLLSY